MTPDLNKYRNVFKGFRSNLSSAGVGPASQTGLGEISSLYSKKYDEPTYLTFSVFFNKANNNAGIANTNFDNFPMPLLSTYVEDSYDIRNGAHAEAEVKYSTLNYLRDTDEFVRAELLDRFINGLNNLQSYYQWYFQNISGLQNILKVNPTSGRRVQDQGKLTMTVLEGIDQKMFNLLNTYKQIAWDSKWQRWMLPDMMRYFSMEIYITEFRTFHAASDFRAGADGSLEGILNMIENVMPTLKITCERCEFDIESINRNIDSYSVGEEPQQKTINFDIKVGNVQEEYINPILDTFYNDKLINGLDRSKEFTSGQGPVPNIPLTGGTGDYIALNNAVTNLLTDPTRISTNNKVFKNTSIQAQGQLGAERSHVTGTPFYENANKLDSIKQTFGTIDNLPAGATFKPKFDPTQPNTWVGNAVNLGTSFVQNFVEQKIDKAKMTKIPGLGISVNEAIGAIESKNFTTVLGLVRQAIDRVHESSSAPSDLLGEQIVDNTFRQFLLGISESKATDGDAFELAQFADLALTDAGTFSRIKDYSLATDLVGPKEINTPNPIENAGAQGIIVDSQTGGDRSIATDLDGGPNPLEKTAYVIDGIPTSQATINDIIKG